MHDRVQFRANSGLADLGPRSNLAADRVELEDLYFLISAHFQKVGSDLILSDDHGQKLALQLRFMGLSESMGDHDSQIVGAGSVD